MEETLSVKEALWGVLLAARNGVLLAAAYVLMLAGVLAAALAALVFLPPLMYWRARREYLATFDRRVRSNEEKLEALRKMTEGPEVVEVLSDVYQEEAEAWRARRRAVARQPWRVGGKAE